MTRSALILAVPHQLQGAKFPFFVDDPAYVDLLEESMEEQTDFVFEEAAGLSPTVAENLANSKLGPSHYVDVDPSRAERLTLGIPADSGGNEFLNPGQTADAYRWELVAVHEKREKLWVERIQARSFRHALIVCGIAHGLSLAFRLSHANVEVEKVYSYIPYDKLCRHR